MNTKILLDTDILSAMMRNDPKVIAKVKAYREQHQSLLFSIISRYEILRGLKTKRADTQLQIFETFCQTNTIIPITDKIMRQASDVYAELHNRGLILGDANVLIAATALVHGYTLATINPVTYQHIEGLRLAAW